MLNKRSSKRVVKSPFNDFDFAANPTSLIQHVPRPKNATFIETLEIKPDGQRRIPLGSFTEENSPKGFLVELNPDPTPADSVVTEVSSLGGHGRYTLYLQIVNHGTELVHADVWQL